MATYTRKQAREQARKLTELRAKRHEPRKRVPAPPQPSQPAAMSSPADRMSSYLDRLQVPPAGVGIEAPWSLWANGFSEVWRRLGRALALSGVPVQMLPDPLYKTPHKLAEAEIGGLRSSVKAFAFIGGFPTAGDSQQAEEMRRLLRGRQHVVLSTMIERDRIGPLSVAAANSAAQVWLFNQQNRDAFRRCGVREEKMSVVHVPFFPDDPHLKLVGRQRDPGPIHFYRIGVADSRKDFDKTIVAFCRAFRPGEAFLTLKASVLRQSLESWRSDLTCLDNGWNNSSFAHYVSVVPGIWSEGQLLDLHRRGDVYLSLSHGEGWDMPAFDALLSGNRMIYTPSGGPQEFASDDDLLVPMPRSVPCDPVYAWEEDACWGDYDLGVAVVALQKAASRLHPKRHARSWTGFTAADVGALMQGLLRQAPASPTKNSSSVKPRHPFAKACSLAIVSLFRQCPERVAVYRERFNELRWPGSLNLVCVEGDSTDETPKLLDAWAKADARVHVLHKNLGKPLFGSVENATRFATLATVTNHGLDYIVQNLDVSHVLYLTSDLLHGPDLAERLLDVLNSLDDRAAAVSPMIWNKRDVFHDTWAFRENAAVKSPLFGPSPTKRHLSQQLGMAPRQLQATGSILLCKAAPIYAGARFTLDMDVVGFCGQLQQLGFTVWADPTTDAVHP